MRRPEQERARRHTQLAILAVLPLLSGCASIVHKARPGRDTAFQVISVTSEPAGARVLIGQTLVGTTPTQLLLKRSDAHIVLRFEKDGWEPAEVRLERTISGALAGNIPFALIPLNPLQGFGDNPWSTSEKAAFAIALPAAGLAIDFLTGAAYKLPPRVHVTLRAPPSREPLQLLPFVIR
jgi:hypothetical protein